MSLTEVPGFADRIECAHVIGAYERCRATCAAATGSDFFDGRVMWINSFPDAENQARRILQAWRHRAEMLLSTAAGCPLYSDTIQVVRWDGQEMPPHQDDRHPDGSPHNTPWREWASIIYLNDDYDGGDIYFPALGTSRKPAAGSVVFFRGSLSHGVRASQGARYTSPSWYSPDPARRDPWASIDY